MTIYKKVLERLTNKNLTISFAESMTGGSLVYNLIKIPNSSKVIQESYVVYSNQKKKEVLNIKIDNWTNPISSDISEQMALKLQEKTKADITISITGNAGPTTDKNSHNLECFFSIYFDNKLTTHRIIFKKYHSRISNIKKTNKIIYKALYELIK